MLKLCLVTFKLAAEILFLSILAALWKYTVQQKFCYLVSSDSRCDVPVCFTAHHDDSRFGCVANRVEQESCQIKLRQMVCLKHELYIVFGEFVMRFEYSCVKKKHIYWPLIDIDSEYRFVVSWGLWFGLQLFWLIFVGKVFDTPQWAQIQFHWFDIDIWLRFRKYLNFEGYWLLSDMHNQHTRSFFNLLHAASPISVVRQAIMTWHPAKASDLAIS